MRGSFFGLNIAVRGLYTAQKNLEVSSHNLNNINTPGFSRQEAVQVASTPIAIHDGTGMVGTGSDISSVIRIKDEYLDYKYWSEAVSQGEWSAKKEMLADIEVSFNEPSDSGFSTILDQFFSSLQELSKDPSSPAVRAEVREKGVTAAKYFNSVAAHLEKLQGDVNYTIRTKVDQINTLADQIGQLNRQIYSTELDGSNANDLRDQRTVLVDKLSRIINIEANEVVTGKLPNGRDDRHFVITISGKAIVNHFNVSKLKVEQRETRKNEEDISGLYEVGWEDGNALEVRGGELKGYLDIRDGKGSISGGAGYNGLPYYMNRLNRFVQAFAMAFNEGIFAREENGALSITQNLTGHVDGYGLDPDKEGVLTAPTGKRFFTMLGDDGNPVSSDEFIGNAATPEEIVERYKNLTAKNFMVSDDIMTDLNNIATSTVDGQNGNNQLATELLALRHNSHMFAEGAPEDFMKSLISSMGINSQQAIRLSSNQEAIIRQIENRRISVSGVSIDEEMAKMVKYQHSYNACAKMIQTMSEIYDTLINKLGV